MLRLLLSIGIGLMAIGAITVGTMAAFTDTESSTGNTATAGTLDLDQSVENVSGSGSVTGATYTVSGVAPGSSGSVQWVLSNLGSIDGTLTAASTLTTADNGAFGPEATSPNQDFDGGADGDLDSFVCVHVERGQGTDQSTAEAALADFLGSAATPVALAGLEASLDAISDSLESSSGNDTIVYRVNWSIESDIDDTCGTGGVDVDDNAIQSDSADLDIDWTLTS